MSFADEDPLEHDMGIRCEDMTPDQLVAYIKSYQEAFGLSLKVDGVKERAVFRGLQKLYGRHDAGRIVKWVFYHHKGRFRDEPVGFFTFSKGNKWFTDKMHLEAQQALSELSRRQSAPVRMGMTNLADL